MVNDNLRQLRALLILGRVSNLPTVWSNCLAGWWLGGGRRVGGLPFLLIGVTFLYLGGMFLNDVFDVEFDRQHRKERPIPAGSISLTVAWLLGLLWILVGLIFLFLDGSTAAVLFGVMLAFCIVLYDLIHKAVDSSPVLMGICRVFVYVISASIGVHGVTGWSIWCGLALGTYVVGLSFIARGESAGGSVRRWPLFLLVMPILLALLMNVGRYRQPALWLSLVLALWIVRCLRTTFWTDNVNVGRTVSGLLAGIVFVDWLAVAPDPELPHKAGFVFLALFVCARLGQRFVPAT